MVLSSYFKDRQGLGTIETPGYPRKIQTIIRMITEPAPAAKTGSTRVV
jgi:hypothetical protein